MEGSPLADYGEFEAANFTVVVAWRDFYAPNYADVFGGNPKTTSISGKGKDKKEEETDKSEAEGSHLHSIQLRSFFYDSFGITKANEQTR
jgi:hypothetical protein